VVEIGRAGRADRAQPAGVPVEEVDLVFRSERDDGFIDVVDDSGQLGGLQLFLFLGLDDAQGLLESRLDRGSPAFQEHRFDAQVARRVVGDPAAEEGLEAFVHHPAHHGLDGVLIDLRPDADLRVEDVEVTRCATEQVGSADHADTVESLAGEGAQVAHQFVERHGYLHHGDAGNLSGSFRQTSPGDHDLDLRVLANQLLGAGVVRSLDADGDAEFAGDFRSDVRNALPRTEEQDGLHVMSRSGRENRIMPWIVTKVKFQLFH